MNIIHNKKQCVCSGRSSNSLLFFSTSQRSCLSELLDLEVLAGRHGSEVSQWAATAVISCSTTPTIPCSCLESFITFVLSAQTALQYICSSCPPPKDQCQLIETLTRVKSELLYTCKSSAFSGYKSRFCNDTLGVKLKAKHFSPCVFFLPSLSLK